MALASSFNPSPRARIKVVTLIDLLGSTGGAERLALTVATRLDPTLFESTLCVSRWPPTGPVNPGSRQAVDQLSAAGVKLLGLGRGGKLDIWAWAKLAGFLRRERIDVLHAHKFGSNVWGTLMGRAAGVPVVLAHEHTWSFRGQPLRRILDRELVARGANRFIAVSREDQRRMIDVERIDPRRTLFVPNGVPSLAPVSDHDVRVELSIDPDVPVIGTVGTLRPQKAHHVLLHAASLLRREWPRLQVLIAGDGPQRTSLERLARELEMSETVRFLGSRADVADVLKALDVAVCSSDFEGSPLAVMEYMNAALPVVATAVGGVPDLIEPGVHGLLVPPGDPTALASATAKLLRDPELARAMGVRGRERQLAEFDLDVLLHRIEALYLELLAEQGQAVARR